MSALKCFGFLFLLLVFTGCTERRQLSLVQDAEENLAQNRYAEAAELLKKAVSANPESKTGLKALYKLGFTFESYLKDYEGALFNYQEFIRLNKDRTSNYEVQKRIANIYFEQNHDSEKAIAAYKKLISLNPESLEIDFFQFRVAQIYFRQNGFDQARVEYQQLLERFPKSQYSAQTRFQIANSYYMESKYEIAIEALKQVLRHHPQSEYSVEAQFLMAECLERQDKLANALQVYESLKGRYNSADVLALRIGELKKRVFPKK